MEAYSILGINKYSSEEAIRQAYKRCLLKSHPDHGGSNDEFNAVRLAYIQVKNNYVKNLQEENSQLREELNKYKLIQTNNMKLEYYIEQVKFLILFFIYYKISNFRSHI